MLEEKNDFTFLQKLVQRLRIAVGKIKDKFPADMYLEYPSRKEVEKIINPSSVFKNKKKS